MKKLIAWTLALALAALWCAALAEDTFEIRNGIRFGMTPEEVVAAEGAEQDDIYTEEGSPWQQYAWNSSKVSKFDAVLFCLFRDGGLHMVTYRLEEFDTESADYLKEALSSVYGEGKAPDTARANQTMSSFMPEPDKAFRYDTSWMAKDGTEILLAADLEPMNGGAYYLFYIDPAFDFTGATDAAYDTNGM